MRILLFWPKRLHLHEMVLALLNESDLFLSEEAVEQIVDQVKCMQIKYYLQFFYFLGIF
uniref:Uncharacterized protein n=1 Tax=Oryza punctata TaxID=4537 RepID=A0A0E0JYN5_ORYPU